MSTPNELKPEAVVGCKTWLGDAEAALEKTREALIRARHEQDFDNWDELCDAQECLQAAVESKRRRSPSDPSSAAALGSEDSQ